MSRYGGLNIHDEFPEVRDLSRTSRGHVSPHDAVMLPGIRPELDTDSSLLMNSAICLIWSRHTLHETNGLLCGNTGIGLDKRCVLQSAQGSVSSCFLKKYLSSWQKVQKMNYAEVL